MPSPIAHLGVGYAIYRLFRPKKTEGEEQPIKQKIATMAAAMGLSLMPDLDIIPGVLIGDFGRFHNGVTNSLFMGLVAAVGVGSIVWLVRRSGFKRWFLLTLVSYYAHVLMDMLTLGRGPMLLWPFVDGRIQPPFKAFYGAHWSQGWLSINHIWTALSETVFVMLFLLLVVWLSSLKPFASSAKKTRS